MTKKQLNQEEVENVNGGYSSGMHTRCPKCSAICYPNINIEVEGSGCDQETYWKCPNCGYKWQN